MEEIQLARGCPPLIEQRMAARTWHVASASGKQCLT